MKILIIILAHFILVLTSISTFSEEKNIGKTSMQRGTGILVVSQPLADGSNTVIVAEGDTVLVPSAHSNYPPGTTNPIMEKAIVEMRERQRKAMRNRLEYVSEPESIRLFAKFYKSLYDSLIEEGFSQKQALKIISGIDVLGSS